jgi:hypothetical protein
MDAQGLFTTKQSATEEETPTLGEGQPTEEEGFTLGEEAQPVTEEAFTLGGKSSSLQMRYYLR